MKKYVLTLLTMILFKNTFACINPKTIALKNGTVIAMDSPGEIIPHGHHFLEENFDRANVELDRLWKKTKNIDYYSDYGIVLILQKKYKEAINVYLDIEKIKPDRYATASNLGTIHDLLGENETAIVWIKKAIAIDPTSHKHSEGLHVKILEAKIKGDPFMNGKFLLNVDFGTDSIPRSTLSRKKLLMLRYALFFQLQERMSFVKPTDKTIAALLFDLGNIAILTDSKAEACDIYEKAQLYGFTDIPFVLRYNTVKRYKKIRKW